MNTCNWSITNMERRSDNGAVTFAYWSCVASTEGTDITAALDGRVRFTADPTSPEFIPYDDLTESEVLGWVYASVDQNMTETKLSTTLDILLGVGSLPGVPW